MLDAGPLCGQQGVSIDLNRVCQLENTWSHQQKDRRYASGGTSWLIMGREPLELWLRGGDAVGICATKIGANPSGQIIRTVRQGRRLLASDRRLTSPTGHRRIHNIWGRDGTS